ncbi:hypothetical protein [Streptomyces flavofungini]|uniref:hypothetical protein n=1 Tax=Streptomyces flavofungini TaxID=68200 RepID=UPI0025B2598A|nr:hypothetical protein [Streptomyces flavofungini]WJV47660.1 hypothetical protein QUY26_20300 [Streptomyces flavofungini]
MEPTDPIKTREECQGQAEEFAHLANRIARRAETMSQREDRHLVPTLVAVGALYADVARTWAALALSAPQGDEEEPRG